MRVNILVKVCNHMDHGFSDIQALYPPSPKMCCFVSVRLEKPIFQNWFLYFAPKIKGTHKNMISSIYSLYH